MDAEKMKEIAERAAEAEPGGDYFEVADQNLPTPRDQGIGAAPPPVGEFEFWLYEQRHRQDRTGAVARFVIEDLKRGFWPETTDLFSDYKRNDAEQRQAWVNHLAGRHILAWKSVEIFCEVHAEYVAARDRRWKWQWAEEERCGGAFNCPTMPGEMEAREAEQQFWRRVRDIQQGRP
ncbi:MAG: hypothetical protein M3Q49_21245, partial [Actinomycetota bacterium]|nr:hypothetical protein [Actinomycetota bacterium]